MIYAEKSPFWRRLALGVIRKLLSDNFARVSLRLPPAAERADAPTILCINHSCRWDGPLALYLSEVVLGLDSYMMTAAHAIRPHPLLRKIGCFEVAAAQGEQVAEAIEHGASLLRCRPDRALIIFPQGEYRRAGQRPLRFQPGFAQIVRRLDRVRLLPVAFSFDCYVDRRPEAFVSLGQPWTVRGLDHPVKALVDEVQQRVTGELDSLQSAVAADNLSGFRVVLEGRDDVWLWLLKKYDPGWVRRGRRRTSDARP